MILVFCKLPEKFWLLRHIQRYPGYYGYFFNLDIIKDNAEAALLTELCFRYQLDYIVMEGDDFYEYDDCPEDFFQSDENATADLEFLDEVLSRHRNSGTARAADHHSVCI